MFCGVLCLLSSRQHLSLQSKYLSQKLNELNHFPLLQHSMYLLFMFNSSSHDAVSQYSQLLLTYSPYIFHYSLCFICNWYLLDVSISFFSNHKIVSALCLSLFSLSLFCTLRLMDFFFHVSFTFYSFTEFVHKVVIIILLFNFLLLLYWGTL
jgi:hypothetical protein